MTAQELETFWVAIPKMLPHNMDPTKTLPGRWKTAETEDEIDNWFDLRDLSALYFAHINAEDDSYLLTPDSKEIFHAGFIGEPVL